MTPHNRDDALSEVIGFILILAVIALAASFYVTYVVPAQGREGEIKHMNYIKDQFVDFKTSVDSLWVNNQVGVSLSRVINPGTLGWTTQGSFVNMPLFTPIGSGGTLSVGESGDSITYTLDSAVVYSNPDLPLSRYIYLTLQNDFSDFPYKKITISNQTLSNWQMYIYVRNSSVTHIPRYDLSLSVIKNGSYSIDGLPIRTGITNFAEITNYPLNLLDSAYGLSDVLTYPYTLAISNDSPFIAVPEISQSVSTLNLPVQITRPLRSFQYNSQNYYWIQQIYSYKLGGVFLTQPDGVVEKVLPLISITQTRQGQINIEIQQINIGMPDQTIGGTTPIQVLTTLDTLQKDIFGAYTLVHGVQNVNSTIIAVTAKDDMTASMWDNTLQIIKQSANQSGIPNNYIRLTPHGSPSNISTMNIDPPPSMPIVLDYSEVNLSVKLQPVASSLS